jgi:hypothetical protein
MLVNLAGIWPFKENMNFSMIKNGLASLPF